MFPSKHHKDDKDKDHKKPSGRKNSFFSVPDKSGLAFIRKKTKDGKDYEVTVEKVKPKSRKSSHSHHDRDALPDIGRLGIEDDPDRYGHHSRGGDSYGSYGSHEYLVRNAQSPGRDSSWVSGSGSSRRYTNTQYPDPDDRDVFYSDKEDESEGPYQDQRGRRGSSSYQPESYQSSRYTGSGSVGTETLYERRHGDLGYGDRHRDQNRYDDGSAPPRDSISHRGSRSQTSHIIGSSPRTIRPGDGSRHGSVQDYDYDYDSDEGYPPPSRHSTSTRRSSQTHSQSSRYTGDSSRYTDDKSRNSYVSGSRSNQQPPPPDSGRHTSHRAPSPRHSQATAPDSPYRPNPHAEVTEAEDRASLRSRGTNSTAYEVPAPGGPSGSRHRAPATGFRTPSRRESAHTSERFTGPDPFQFQVPPSYTSDDRPGIGTGTTTSRSTASRGTGASASSGYPPTARIFHYYEEGNESTVSGSGTSSRGTAHSTRSRTGTSIPSDSDSDDTITAYRRERRRGSSHGGSGHHRRRDSRGQDGGGGRGGSWIGSSQDGFSTFG